MPPRRPPPDELPDLPPHLANRFKPYRPSPLREAYPGPTPSSPLQSSEDISSAISRSSEKGNDPEDGGGYDGDKDEEENEPGQADAKRSRRNTHAAQLQVNEPRASGKASATKQRQDKNAVAWSGPTTRAAWRKSISEAASDATKQRSKCPRAVSGSSILARNLQMLGVNAGQGEMRKACEASFEQGRDLVIDRPLSYNQTVTVYFLLCLNLLKRLKQQGYIPETVDEQVEDPRTKATEDPLVDSSEHSSTQNPVDTRSPSTATFSPAGKTSSLPEQLAENPGGDGSSLEEEDAVRLTIEEDEGGGVPGEQNNPIVISEDSISEGYTSSEKDGPLKLPRGQANPTNPIVAVPPPRSRSRLPLPVRPTPGSNPLDTSGRNDTPLSINSSRSQHTTGNETSRRTDRSSVAQSNAQPDLPLFIQPTGIQPTIERNSIAFDVVILCSSPDLAICYYDIVRTLMRGIGLAVSLAIETDNHEAQEQEISRGCTILITDFPRLVKLIQVFEMKISVLVVEDVNGVFQNSHKNELEKLNSERNRPVCGCPCLAMFFFYANLATDVCTQETRFIFISAWWNAEAQPFALDLFLASKQRRDNLICHVDEEFIPARTEDPLYAQHRLKSRGAENMGVLYQRLAPLKRSGKAKVLILCREARAVDIICHWVEEWGFVTRTHLTDRVERDRILDGWNSGKIRAVVTTEDLADGMAMEGITDLVTWQLPMNENIKISQWKYWRRLERDHMEAPQTLVFVSEYDRPIIPFLTEMMMLGEPSAIGNLERPKDIVKVMWNQFLPNQGSPDGEGHPTERGNSWLKGLKAFFLE